MSKGKRVNPSPPDADSPESTAEDFDKARPAAEVLPQYIGEEATQELLRRGRGRPPKESRKVTKTLRLDPDTLDAYKQEGKGWQTRTNQVLRHNTPRH